MIRDAAIKQEIREDWDGVRMFQSRLQAHLNISGGMDSTGATHQLRNISHNLTLLFAFSVFERTLKQLKDEGIYQERSNFLKKLMISSKNNLNWKNYSLVDEAREERNKIAHQQEVLERGKCWEYIDAIEEELLSWNIIEKPKIFKH